MPGLNNLINQPTNHIDSLLKHIKNKYMHNLLGVSTFVMTVFEYERKWYFQHETKFSSLFCVHLMDVHPLNNEILKEFYGLHF